MTDEKEISISLKNKKFSEISTGKKVLFFVSLSVMIMTLVYTGLNLDTLNYRVDTLKDSRGCELTFIDGFLKNYSCTDVFINDSLVEKYTIDYTLSDYYEDHATKTGPDYGLAFNFTG